VGHARPYMGRNASYPRFTVSVFLSAAECSRLQAIMNRPVRYGFLPTHYPPVGLGLSDLFQSADQSLFQSVIRNPHHILHQYHQSLTPVTRVI